MGGTLYGNYVQCAVLAPLVSVGCQVPLARTALACLVIFPRRGPGGLSCEPRFAVSLIGGEVIFAVWVRARGEQLGVRGGTVDHSIFV